MKYDGKDASKCAMRGLRGNALIPISDRRQATAKNAPGRMHSCRGQCFLKFSELLRLSLLSGLSLGFLLGLLLVVCRLSGLLVVHHAEQDSLCAASEALTQLEDLGVAALAPVIQGSVLH